MDGPAPRYIVFDDAPQIKGLGCTADELAAALRVPLAVVGVRVVRQRGVTSKALFSEFQARGMSRKQYDTKAIQVARIVDEVARAIRRGAIPTTAPYCNEARPV